MTEQPENKQPDKPKVTNNLPELNISSDDAFTQEVSPHYEGGEDLHVFSELDTRPALGRRRVFRLFIPRETEPLEFFSLDRLVIGRGGKGVQIDLNLSEHYGWMLGVSRQHAEIVYDTGTYYITDLGSTNGTWLNSTQLSPNERYPLESHDQIRLGHFLMLVSVP
ncbi:MAG: FHA domain-containing protein [Chloroflexota bacterium]